MNTMTLEQVRDGLREIADDAAEEGNPYPVVSALRAERMADAIDAHLRSREAAKMGMSDELRKLPALWRQIEQSDEPKTEFDKGYEQANRECADNLDAVLEAVAPMLAASTKREEG